MSAGGLAGLRDVLLITGLTYECWFNTYHCLVAFLAEDALPHFLLPGGFSKQL